MAAFFKKLKASDRRERLSERLNSFQAAYKPTMSMSQTESFPPPNRSRPQSTTSPSIAQFDSAHVTIGAGVSIFHLATARVVLCYDTVRRYYFLPKGRRNANEDTSIGAEREGYEESGYRNRLIPLPTPTRQPIPPPHPSRSTSGIPYITEPIWTQLLPVNETSQYILHWYIAETLPPTLDAALTRKTREHGGGYQVPMRWQEGMTIRERVQLDVQLEPGLLGNATTTTTTKTVTNDGGGVGDPGERYHDPVRHDEREVVQEEERAYRSELVPWEEACRLLGEGSVSADVVRRGWVAVELRLQMEEEERDEREEEGEVVVGNDGLGGRGR